MMIPFVLSHLQFHPHKAAAPAVESVPTPSQQLQNSGVPTRHAAASGTTTATGTTGTSTGASGSGNSASITANDFLTLLVTEIQNQDPTSQTDPMTYITQLVGVNSLQQLLQINQTLTTAVGPGGTLSGTQTSTTSTTPAGGARTSSVAGANAATASAALPGAIAATGTTAGAIAQAAGVQASSASSNAVAQAFTHPAIPQQVAPPTQVPLNPEVMRALEHSIPGAQMMGPSLRR